MLFSIYYTTGEKYLGDINSQLGEKLTAALVLDHKIIFYHSKTHLDINVA